MPPRVNPDRKSAAALRKARSNKLPAVGKTTVKRTPKHIADVAAKEERTYEVEAIVGKAFQLGREVWLIKWAGYDEKHNTYEPLNHLPGYEGLIAAFNKEHNEQQARHAIASAASCSKQVNNKKKQKARASTGMYHSYFLR
jgi:hypothetical protein